MQQISKLLSVILDGQSHVRNQKQCGEWPRVLLPLPLRIHTLSEPSQTEPPPLKLIQLGLLNIQFIGNKALLLTLALCETPLTNRFPLSY